MKKLILILAFLSSCASPNIAVNKNADFSKIKRVAVLDFKGPQGNAACEIMTIALLRYGADVVERQELNAVIKEIDLSQTNIIEPATRKKIGKILGVDAIFIGSVINYKPETKYILKEGATFDSVKEIKGKHVYTQAFDPLTDSKILETTAEVGLSVRMIDVESGSILWSGYMTWEGLDTISTITAITEYFIKSLKNYWKF